MCYCNPSIKTPLCHNCPKALREKFYANIAVQQIKQEQRSELDISKVKSGSVIKYIGNNIFKYESETYTVIENRETYSNEEDCPIGTHDELIIIEITSNDTPLYLPVSKLDANEWELIDE